MQFGDEVKDKFNDTSEAIKNSLAEVRALSKTLNNEVVLNLGFEKSVANELARLKKMKFDTAKLKIIGERLPFKDKKHEIIVFRIIQEFLSNSVKYSEAKHINLILDYKPEELLITATDDGVGFDIESAEKGSGLLNMKSRAALINARLDLTSQANQGVKLILHYPLT